MPMRSRSQKLLLELQAGASRRCCYLLRYEKLLLRSPLAHLLVFIGIRKMRLMRLGGPGGPIPSSARPASLRPGGAQGALPPPVSL